MNYQKGLLVSLAFIVVAAAGGYFVWQKYYELKTSGATYCTQDAIQCPDGSYVGRQGPNCEFAQCPAPGSAEVEQKTYTDTTNGITFDYPTNFASDFVRLNSTPQAFMSASGSKTIDADGCYLPVPRTTIIGKSLRTIGIMNFCVTTMDEHRAGQIYRTYWYTTPQSGKYVTLEFVIYLPNSCDSYYGKEKYTPCGYFMQYYHEIVEGRIENGVATLKVTK